MPLALFDLGRTLVDGDPVIQWAQWLRGRGVGRADDWQAFDRSVARYRQGLDPELAAVEITEAFARLFAGWPAGEVERSARQAYAEAVRPRLYPYARAVVQLARARGLQVIGITGVTQPLAEALAEDLGMDRVFGTPLAMRDGCATGEAVWGSPAGWKEERLGPLMNDPASDLPESLGMGDSAADLPLLGRLGRPVVVNPSPEVAAQARERGWPVLTAQDGVAERVAQLLQGPAWNRPPQGDGALRPPPPPHRER